MTQLSSPVFGAPINMKNSDANMGANALVSQFLSMKGRYKNRLKSIMSPKDGDQDPHACRYFCESDCAYIFSAEILQALLDAMPSKKDIEGKETKNGCVVLFQGLRKDKKAKNAFGRPTIIACPYEVIDDNTLKQITQFSYTPSNDAKATTNTDGFEHPGDGIAAPNPITIQGTSDMTSPVVDLNTSDIGDTEYIIKDKIDMGTLFNSFQ